MIDLGKYPRAQLSVNEHTEIAWFQTIECKGYNNNTMCQ